MFKYASVGLLGFVFQILFFKFLENVLNVNYILSIFISINSATVINYFLNNIYTFRSMRLKGKNLFRGLLIFLVFSIIPISSNFSITLITFSVSNNIVVSKFCGVFSAYLINYFITSKLIWNDVL